VFGQSGKSRKVKSSAERGGELWGDARAFVVADPASKKKLDDIRKLMDNDS